LPLSRVGMGRARRAAKLTGALGRLGRSLADWWECRIAIDWCLDNGG